MNDTTKFWIQTLIIPIVLAFFGFLINNTLQEKQRAFDKVKFTDQVLNEAFDSNNFDKALAISVLIPQIVEDVAFADTLKALINRHYLNLAANALKSGNDTLYHQISDAAKGYQSGALTDSLQSSPLTSRAETASNYENTGLQQIQQGKLSEAKLSFEKANETYPGFHSSYEISNLLKKKVEEVNNGADSNLAKKEVIEAVKKNYSWKLPVAILQKQQ